MQTLNRKSLVTWTIMVTVVVALVAVTAVGCGSDTNTTGGDTSGTDTTEGATEATETTAATDASLTLTEADNGKSFTLSVGDTITVSLAGNATTGYAWEADLPQQSAPLLTLVDEPLYTPDAVAEGVVGSGGKYTFNFTAVAAGQAELKLKYWRSFEPQAEPEQTFTASITIK